MKNKKFESIKKNFEFSLIYSKGKTLSDKNILVKYLPSKKFRLGLSVSKKVSKLAVTRNKIKRQLRNIFYSYDGLPNVDLFVIVKPSYNPQKYNEIKLSLYKLISKIK